METLALQIVSLLKARFSIPAFPSPAPAIGDWFIQDEPIQPELLHGLGEFDEINRFPDITIRA